MQFIINEVLHYVHCTETPDLAITPAVDKAYLESVILDILNRNKSEAQEIVKPVSPQPVKKEDLYTIRIWRLEEIRKSQMKPPYH